MEPAVPHAPRLLLVEDDPVSAEFFRQALQVLPARVDLAGSVLEGRERARASPYDLWLIDARLPDGEGAALLAALRRHNLATPALAHTADASPSTRTHLLAAGFDAVAIKPLAAATLRGHVADLLALALDWDNQRALEALGGQAAHVAALRGLFLAELPVMRSALQAAAARGDAAALREVLHRLKASCALVGARRLARWTQLLDQAPASAWTQAQVQQAIEALLASQPPSPG